MSKYSTVQTGPKTSFGGRSGGFSNDAYHVGMFGIVASEPIAPAVNEVAIQATAIKNDRILWSFEGKPT